MVAMAAVTERPLLICADAKPAWFDPHNQIAGAARLLADNVVPGLLTVGDDAAPASGLAGSWRWETPTLARLELVEGQRFTSGRLVDSVAVRDNLRRVTARGRPVFNRAEFSAVSEVEATSRSEIVIRLRRAWAPLFGVLANGLGMVDLQRGEPPQNMVGAGAFRVAGVRSRSIQLVAAGNGSPIEWTFCTTREARRKRIRAAAADILLGGAGAREAEASGWTNLRCQAGGPMHLTFNMRRWPMSELGFRRAVADALDPDEIVRVGLGGLARSASSPYPADSAFTVASESCRHAAPRTPRVDAELTLAFGGEVFRPTARLISRALLRLLGVRTRIVSVLNPAWWPGEYLAARWDIALQAWTPMPDPHFIYGRRYASDGIHNAAGYKNLRLDRLVSAAASTINQRERLTLYSEAESIRARDLPTLYLAFPDRVAWVKPGVRGLVLRPSWAVGLDRLAREEAA